ncbi:hypothetical protein halTADL_3040 [Halohasta litchfieldiae]|uniref:Glycoside hydrolase domain protein n=1 Tax=Halohasta litchfieldiae TaxID=1073996 RepID=A0A1H6RC78_9EURY|nr:hypothetical protein [Halohasta litchfieldiae]ATW89742.1 hypothetical protein halTADL_3040 [Halohasta litchfieldiae]SEI53439.1 hypothetical protein SAMN05444271_10285 [Halohasta litchfieldiae]
MYGVVTRNVPEVDWPEFSRAFYEVKSVSGRPSDPISNATNMVSCFADNAAAGENPDLVPVDEAGQEATRDRKYFDWAYICPTHDAYREGLLEIIADCAEANPDVRLDDVGFPREGYCHCERCEQRFEASDYEEWTEWRASIITDFVAEASDRVPGDLSVTLYPDPYPGHLYERAGLDLDALSEFVDEFVVPLYDLDYGTTYWLETIGRGFRTALGGSYDPNGQEPDTPFSVELYAVDVDVDNLIQVAEIADTYAKDVLFGYDAAQASAAIRRKDADQREGESYGPE